MSAYHASGAMLRDLYLSFHLILIKTFQSRDHCPVSKDETTVNIVGNIFSEHLLCGAILCAEFYTNTHFLPPWFLNMLTQTNGYWAQHKDMNVVNSNDSCTKGIFSQL